MQWLDKSGVLVVGAHGPKTKKNIRLIIFNQKEQILYCGSVVING